MLSLVEQVCRIMVCKQDSHQVMGPYLIEYGGKLISLNGVFILNTICKT